MLRTNGSHFINDNNEMVVLRGMNFSGDMKVPINGSYIDSMPLNLADIHLAKIRNLGFNTLRMIFTWEALEPDHPGVYNEEYINYMVELLKKCKSHGFYVFMDPHQDAWSRFSFGSGAPLWTLHALGLNPDHFKETVSAVAGDASRHIKMLWASNYHRLVCQVMFTAFFAGRDFFPKLIINGQNIQDLLESHYLNAVSKLATAIADEDPTLVFGWESLNEPGHGLVGYSDLDKLPFEQQHVKLGPSPTPFQGMLLALGIEQTVDRYVFTSIGARKNSTQTVNPKGKSAWLESTQLGEIDKANSWNRDWPGGCVFKLHGIYQEPDKLLEPTYFAYSSLRKKAINENTFVDEYFLEHYSLYKDMIRSIREDWIILMQPPVNCEPPNFADKRVSPRCSNIIDELTAYSPHYYDGMTLMLRQWRFYNVDALGVIRKKYSSVPITALRVGGSAIRQNLRSQLTYLKDEGCHYLQRKLPVVISEIGIPFDIDPSCHIRAMDAHCHALEQGDLNHALWVYTRTNTHAHGDNWNGEDLSIFCADEDKDSTDLMSGIRATEAVARPYPISTTGIIQNYGFDIKNGFFSCRITFPRQQQLSHAEFVLPSFYFPEHLTDEQSVVVSSGTWTKKKGSLIWAPSETGNQMIHIKTASKYVHPPCALS